jgi:hypothetical protein
MSRLKFVVVGTLRNGAKRIEGEIQSLSRVLEPLGDVYFLVVESDSSDDTVKTLSEISEKNPNFFCKSLGVLESSIPDRIERLIFCRNVYVTELRESKALQNADFVIVADLDGINRKLKTENISSSISRLDSWDALCANQSGRYYDLLALRHKYWCPQNVFEEYSWLRKIISAKKAKKITIFSKMIRIPRDSGLISVDSAFGGFAIYRATTFLYNDYTRLPRDNQSDIDHVILSRRIRESGGKVYIDSQLINAGWVAHSLSSFALFRGLAKIKKEILRK